MPPAAVDVAVVGGGISGLYAGWSLLARVPEGEEFPRVALFEAGSRLGGRLHTIVPPHAPHLRCELGGMRYLSTQPMVADLIDHLGLTHRAFPLGDDHDLLYLRGTRFSIGDLKAGASSVPYALAPGERGKTVAEMLAQVIKTFLPGGQMTADERVELERTMRFRGTPVHELPLVEVLRAELSEEAFQLLLDGMGYTCTLDEHIGAVNLLHTNLVGGHHLTLAEGMQALPDTVAQRFRGLGGQTEMGASLRTLERVEAHGEERIRLVFDRDGRTEHVEARHVVLALPKRALQLLDHESFLFRESSLGEDLQAVVPVPAGKLYLAYRDPWWHDLGLTWGRSVTDLPMRQCLYFGVEDDADAGHHHASLLAAAYTDGLVTRYWEDLLDGSAPFASDGDTPPGLAVTRRMVEDIQSQLERVHGVALPPPTWAVFKDWTVDPFGAGWHYWRTGYHSAEIIPRVRRPMPGANVHVCGEAYSSHQGWILGALSSAERVLQDGLGVAPPEWLSAGAELGP